MSGWFSQDRFGVLLTGHSLGSALRTTPVRNWRRQDWVEREVKDSCLPLKVTFCSHLQDVTHRTFKAGTVSHSAPHD